MRCGRRRRSSSSRGPRTASARSRVPTSRRAGTARGKNGPAGAVLNYWLKDALPEPPPEEGRGREGEEESGRDHDPRRRRREDPDALGAEQGRREPRRLGPALRADDRGAPAHDALRAIRTSGRRSASAARRRATSSTTASAQLKNGPLVAPGTYTVRLAVNGQDAGVQKLVVRKDPNSAGTEADVEASTKLSLSIYRDTNASATMINQLEWTRKQLEDLRKMLTAEEGARRRLRVRRRPREEGPGRRGPPPAADARRGRPEVVPRTAAALSELLWLQAEVGAGRRGRLGQRGLSADEAGARGLRPPVEAARGRAARLRRPLREGHSGFRGGVEGTREAVIGGGTAGAAARAQGRGRGRRRLVGLSRQPRRGVS